MVQSLETGIDRMPRGGSRANAGRKGVTRDLKAELGTTGGSTRLTVRLPEPIRAFCQTQIPDYSEENAHAQLVGYLVGLVREKMDVTSSP